MPHWFSWLSAEWTVPGFDLSLGTPAVAFLDVLATPTITFTIDPPDTEMLYAVFLLNPWGGIAGAEGYSAHYWPPDGDWTQPIWWRIETHADSHAYYDIRASSTWDIRIEGVARATYLYEPAVTAVPEPTTLLLLGSGLIASRVKRRRRSL